MTAPFLTADWRYLVMLNYAIDPAVLEPLVPRGTDMDAWDGHTLVSLVGFLFLNTRVKGTPIPFHRDFEEVNLRFYVSHVSSGEERRGVVFIKEIVPRFAIAAVARRVYNENYVNLPMAHRFADDGDQRSFAYEWTFQGSPQGFHAACSGDPSPLEPDSHEAYITEHYWGYTRQRDGGTLEYRVEHPPWRVWTAESAGHTIDVAGFYGEGFVESMAAAPYSAFVAEGSPVAVYPGRRL